MKKALILFFGIIIVYVIVFVAIKWLKPECVKYNDYFVWWYRYPSYPGRYLCAMFKRNTYWHDGIWVLTGNNGYGNLISLKNSIGEVRVNIHDDDLINRVKAINDGTEVYVRFDNYLSGDNRTFDDYFIYYVCDIK